MLGRTDHRMRMVVLLLVFAVIGSAATARLGYWQVVAAADLAARAERGMVRPDAPSPPRAEILDRDGRVLAQSATLDKLEAHPVLIRVGDRAEVVATLAEIMGLRSGADRQAYADKLSSGTEWARLEQQITPAQSIDISLAMDKGLLPGITLNPQRVRIYPRPGGQDDASLASQLLGFVDASGNGMSGIERLYDRRLIGENDTADVATMVGAAVPTGSELPSLRLTIDAKLQRQLEAELFSARLTTRAKSVSAIVMDPYTGAILASASVPGFDANDYSGVAKRSPGRIRDRVVSDFFEPGSVMKIFTAAAALDLGVVTPRTKIKDEVKLRFYDDVIQNADQDTRGMISVKDGIAWSRNNVAAKIAQRLAPRDHQKASRKLYSFWKKVGVVGKTGVDIASESAGLGYDTKRYKWAPVDLANRAFGQGMAVTLIQLARGVSTLANGGYRVQPHVVVDGDMAAVEPVRVLDPKVARQALDIMVHVTGSLPWYAKGSLIPGYLIGGKTGTAQIWDNTLKNADGEKGDWKKTFNHNFIGFVGGDRPEAVIAVRLEEPKIKVTGQGLIDSRIESYELFRMVARAAIKHLGIEKSDDPNAGLPILGTLAAQKLTPGRNTEARQQAARKRRAAEQKSRQKSERRAENNDAADADKAPRSTNRRAARDRKSNAGRAGQARSSGGVDS